MNLPRAVGAELWKVFSGTTGTGLFLEFIFGIPQLPGLGNILSDGNISFFILILALRSGNAGGECGP